MIPLPFLLRVRHWVQILVTPAGRLALGVERPIFWPENYFVLVERPEGEHDKETHSARAVGVLRRRIG